jgi:2-oxoisovalerate dehydrogenase E1 component alpha subunit
MKTTASSTAATAAAQPKHVALGLDHAQLLEMYEKLLQARLLDQKMWVLNRQGKAAFVISCQGQEAAQVGSAYALDRHKDFFLPYYRDLGVVLVQGLTLRDVMLGVFARRDDPSSGGRQMPAHWGSRARRIITQSSVVATQLPHCAGLGLSFKIKGQDSVAIAYLGEGSTSQGDFHEALNWAGVHRLPCIFLVENNKYAITEPQEKQMAVRDVADRAAGYGLPGVVVDGNEVLAVYEATKEAARRARAGEGATLIEAKTYRLVPHSSDDNDRRYRTPEEVEEWRRRDPIDRFKSYLLAQGILDEEADTALRARIKAAVDAATEEAQRAAAPDAGDLLRHVYADPPATG